jgi:hypothetical protein
LFGCDGYVGLQRFGVFSVIVEGMMEEKKGAVCHEIRVTHKKEKKNPKNGSENKTKKKRNFSFRFWLILLRGRIFNSSCSVCV